MKRSFLVAGICSGLCAGLWMMAPVLAAAQDSSKIIAMENLWNRAELSNDAAAVKLRVTDQYEQTSAVDVRTKGFTNVTATAIPVHWPPIRSVRYTQTTTAESGWALTMD